MARQDARRCCFAAGEPNAAWARHNERVGHAPRSNPDLVSRCGVRFRGTGGSDRGDAPHSRGREEVDQRRAVSARAKLLHAAARSRGPATRDLHRLADAPHCRWTGRRHAVHSAGSGLHPGPERDLCHLPADAIPGSNLLRPSAGRPGDRRRSGDPHREARTQERGDAVDCHRSLRRDLLFRCPLSTGGPWRQVSLDTSAAELRPSSLSC